MAKKKEQKKPLTVESLKNLGFRMLTHINGGSTFSSMTRDNKEYGLLYCYETDGSPDYKYLSRVIATYDGKIVLDLMAEDKAAEYERFVEQYNERILKVVS